MTTLELRKTFLEVIEELKPIFPEVTANTYITIFNETAKKRYGQCRRISPYHFEISINKLFAEICSINKVKNTIVHEILHALPGGMTHKGDWARYAQTVNSKLPHYKITRTNFYKEYNQAIQTDVKYIQKTRRLRGSEIGGVIFLLFHQNFINRLIVTSLSICFA